jgi:vancomycin resistance protein VanW
MTKAGIFLRERLYFGLGIMNLIVEKPKHRSRLRKVLGKEYFCVKQNMEWWFGSEKLAKLRKDSHLDYLIKEHQSFLLRPLKDVDMQLQYNKVTNLKLAIAKIDGIIIQPGETFSLWQLVGRPTESKGYLEGMTLNNGRVQTGIGGGLCQLGNLIYWMTLHTPLTITKRWRHSYDVFPDVNRKIPFGSGATLSYNYIDLQIRNETSQPYQINLWLNKTHLNGNVCTSDAILSTYKVFEKNHRFELQWWGGYTRHNEIWRRVINRISNNESEEMLTANHAIMMYNPLIE